MQKRELCFLFSIRICRFVVTTITGIVNERFLVRYRGAENDKEMAKMSEIKFHCN